MIRPRRICDRARIRELRRGLGMTQTEFAAALRCNLASVSRWELGYAQPTESRLQDIAGVLGVDADELRTTASPPPVISNTNGLMARLRLAESHLDAASGILRGITQETP